MVKIDREFVGNIPRNPHDSILVKAITGLTHSFAMSVTAVGVENAEQLDFVRRNGCDLIQGYLIGRPMPAATLVDWWRAGGARTTVSQAHGRPTQRPPLRSNQPERRQTSLATAVQD